MTKREMLNEIAAKVKGNQKQIDKGIEWAILNKPKGRIAQVYSHFIKFPSEASFCLQLLTGIQFT